MNSKLLKKSIVLTIVPVFVLAGCSDNELSRHAIPNPELNEQVQTVDDGSYREQESAHELNKELEQSYAKAKENGYTGTEQDWSALAQLHQSNPEEAQAKAEESGFSGGGILLGALAGVAVASMLQNNSRSNLVNSGYTAQRNNNSQNYAYSRPKDEQKSTSSSAFVGSNNAANSTTTKPTNSNLTASSSSRSKASYSSVSRGGFGGAVSSGG